MRVNHCRPLPARYFAIDNRKVLPPGARARQARPARWHETRGIKAFKDFYWHRWWQKVASTASSSEIQTEEVRAKRFKQPEVFWAGSIRVILFTRMRAPTRVPSPDNDVQCLCFAPGPSHEADEFVLSPGFGPSNSVTHAHVNAVRTAPWCRATRSSAKSPTLDIAAPTALQRA